ncbi:hypothetical protein LINPERHAP1_LOCUS39135 [Linum perenne]
MNRADKRTTAAALEFILDLVEVARWAWIRRLSGGAAGSGSLPPPNTSAGGAEAEARLKAREDDGNRFRWLDAQPKGSDGNRYRRQGQALPPLRLPQPPPRHSPPNRSDPRPRFTRRALGIEGRRFKM